MKTVTIQIGNSDDKLTQSEWSQYCDEVRDFVNRIADEVHFEGYAPSDSKWQNAAFVCVISDEQVLKLRGGVSNIRMAYRQDSVAWTEGVTQFI